MIRPTTFLPHSSRNVSGESPLYSAYDTPHRVAEELLERSNVNKVAQNYLESQQTLLGKWDLYYHLPQNKNWDLASYKLILGDIDTADKLVSICEALTQNVAKYCMLFVMRSGITPMWEDPKNRNGGVFSYKVANKFVPDVWRTMFYALCGETLSTNPKFSPLINGITVSPKKSFCIVKIWMADMSMQDGSVIIDIPNLTKHGVAFKAHKPEF